MSNKPSLVFVPGAWHTIETWDKLTQLLQAEGQYNCVSVALPSSKGDPSATFEQDISAVRHAIGSEIAQRRDVVVVMHSYGGAVGQSAVKGLTRPKQDGGTPKAAGYVIGLIVMASAFIQTGVGFLAGLGGKPSSLWKIDPDGFAVVNLPARELFYHDLPDEEANYWVGNLQKHSLKSLTEGGEHSYAGWKDVPVWFLATADDKGFPVAAQKMMAESAKQEGGDITVREIASSHSPMLSRPKETAQVIEEAVATLTR